jgi:hypothetical protein
MGGTIQTNYVNPNAKKSTTTKKKPPQQQQ